MSLFSLGESIPPDTSHVSPVASAASLPGLLRFPSQPDRLLLHLKAVSVSLPTWESNVGYEEGQEWVVSRMTTGYPRYGSLSCIGLGRSGF